MTGELRAGERETRRPEPNTFEAARALRDELNRGEKPRGYTPWVTGGMPPNMIVYRERRWMPEDVEAPAAEVEAEYLERMREIHLGLYSGEIEWCSIETHGVAPETRLEVILSSTRAPDRLYGVRWRIWPLDAPTVESAVGDYFDIGVMEYFADGIGADARLGRIPVEPGQVHWLNPEV